MDLTIDFHKVAALGQYCAPRARLFNLLNLTMIYLKSLLLILYLKYSLFHNLNFNL